VPGAAEDGGATSTPATAMAVTAASDACVRRVNRFFKTGVLIVGEEINWLARKRGGTGSRILSALHGLKSA
jgi:hypothetical protein